MKKALSILGILLFFSTVLAGNFETDNESLNEDNIALKLNEVASKYQIKINWKISSDLFPDYWKKAPINAQASAIAQKELARFPKILNLALAKYPLNVLKKNLKGINIVGKMMFYGVDYGGTYLYGKIYMTSSGAKHGYSDNYLISTFHHEFSSVLMHNYRFPKQEWKACNNPSFKYATGGKNAIKEGKASLKGSNRLYREGFMSQYSKSALEEDFNVFSENVLANPEKMKKLIKIYPLIRRKFRVWMKFYNSIDPTFGERIFL